MLKENFTTRAAEAHKGYYQYDQVPATFKATDKVGITCPRHGVFMQQVSSHMRGVGCPKCKADKISARHQLGAPRWVARCQEKFGDTLDYSLVPKGTTGRTQVTVICKEHGDFQVTLKSLLKSPKGCPTCSLMAAVQQRALTREEFVERSTRIHKDTYQYDLVDFNSYQNQYHKVDIICPQHGVFTKTVKRHLAGEGCPACTHIQSLADQKEAHAAQLFDELRRLNPDVDFSHAVYVNNQTPLDVVCPKHGPARSSVKLLRSGYGCRECYLESMRKPVAEWRSDFERIHGDKYRYHLLVNGIKSNEKGSILCTKHHPPYLFHQVLSDHLGGHGCPRCKLLQTASGPSKAELDLAMEIFGLGYKKLFSQLPVQHLGREFLFDIVALEAGIAVEYNGLYFHNQKFIKDSGHHLRRSKAAEANELRLVHIFEDDWRNRKPVVQHFLKYLLAEMPSIMARKTSVTDVDHATARSFYKQYHMQGPSIQSGQLHYGLEHQGELVACMSFTAHGSGRKVLHEGHWELVRFASKLRIQGGASKLFTAFIRQHSPKSVLSFSWSHLFSGGMYERLGFKLDKILPPDYTYVDRTKCRRLHKSGFQHSKLKTKFGENYDPTLSERLNCEANGFYRIFDCGKKRWLWTP